MMIPIWFCCTMKGGVIQHFNRGAFMGELSIGRMADLNCVSEKALRLYHQKHILEPVRIDETTGYRFYSYEQCSIIDLIQQMQDIGMSLGTIKQLLDQHDQTAFEAKVKEQLDAIAENMQQLSIARQNALSMLEDYRTVRETALVGTIMIERIPERHALRFPILNPDAEYLGRYAKEYLEEWEFNLRLTKKHMRDKGLPLNLFRRVGCTISREDLVARTYRLSSSFIFIKEIPEEAAEFVETVPSGSYLTMLQDGYSGPHGGNQGIHCLEKVLDFADEHNFEIAGDYYGEIIAETPAFSYEGRDMLFKIQIPISLG